MKPLSGKAIMRQLRASTNLPIGDVTRKRSGQYAGCYELEFFHPGWELPVLPAAEYAAQLKSHLSGSFEVIHTYQILRHWIASPSPMCSVVIIRFVDAVATIPIPRIHLLPAPRIAGYLTAGQVAAVVTRYAVGDVLTIPGMQRKAAVLEVDTNKTQPFYRVSLMDGLAHKWYSEQALKDANPQVIEFPVIRERAA